MAGVCILALVFWKHLQVVLYCLKLPPYLVREGMLTWNTGVGCLDT